jgi:hypothetical protein
MVARIASFLFATLTQHRFIVAEGSNTDFVVVPDPISRQYLSRSHIAIGPAILGISPYPDMAIPQRVGEYSRGAGEWPVWDWHGSCFAPAAD